MAVEIQLRRDSAANWTSENPTLAEGEPGYETDTGKIKYGDGVSAWADLPYAGGGSQTVEWRGPYHVDFTDIENVGDSIELFTPATGETILSTSINPRTYVPIDNAGGSMEVNIGHASELPDTNAVADFSWLKLDSDLIDGSPYKAINETSLYDPSVVPGHQIDISEMFPLAEPVICLYNYDGGDDMDPHPLTAGEMDFYFLVATAVAP